MPTDPSTSNPPEAAGEPPRDGDKDGDKIKNIVEAALLAAQTPLSARQIGKLFAADPAPPAPEEIRQALETLRDEYADRGVELKEVASGYCFRIRSRYANWVNRIWEERPPRFSRALLETLAIIAYRQPITRAEIEEIRGVLLSVNLIRTLQEREWIRVVGHRETPGRPELLATTRAFLDYFGLKKLSELPPLPELQGEAPEEEGNGTQAANIPMAADAGTDGEIKDEEPAPAEAGHNRDTPAEETPTTENSSAGR